MKIHSFTSPKVFDGIISHLNDIINYPITNFPFEILLTLLTIIPYQTAMLLFEWGKVSLVTILLLYPSVLAQTSRLFPSMLFICLTSILSWLGQLGD